MNYKRPYIYKVTDRENGEFYIGSQCRGKIIGMNYFTSSCNKEFKNKFKSNPCLFDIKIIGLFTDATACILQENIFVRDNIKNPLCLNMNYIIGEKVQFSNAGRKFSEEHLRKMSEVQKGKYLSEETKKKIREKTGKKVICIETGIVYNSTREVEKVFYVAHEHISRCCRGKQKTVGGYHWRYYGGVI